MKTIVPALPKIVEPHFLLGNSVWLYQYGNAYEYIRKDFPDIPIHKVSMAVEGDDLIKMPKSVGVGSIEIATIVDNLKPEIILTVADRYETLATATVAAYTNTALIHLQGGEQSGTIDDKVRDTITQLADFHFPATNKALQRIVKMRGSDDNMWNFGCPSMDTLLGLDGMEALQQCRIYNLYDPQAEYFDVLTRVLEKAFREVNAHGQGEIVTCTKPYMIIMLHPDTTHPISKHSVDALMEELNGYDYQKLIFWNNIDPGGESIAKEIRFTQERYWKNEARFLKHVEPEIFGALLYNCSLLVGNSSAGIREATFMGTPSVTLGRRQESRECGSNVKRANWGTSDVKNKIDQVIDKPGVPSPLYGVGDAGKRIAAKIGEIADGIQ